MNNKINFLTSSIQDIQSIIRAIDTKVGALMLVILIPFANLGKIVAYINNFLSNDAGVLAYIIVIIFILFWLLSLIAAFRVISAIDNPENHIINSSSLKGTYYAGELFKTGFSDVFLNRDVLKASKEVDSYNNDFSNEESDISKELVFEQMKLAYIRDIKICRLNFGIKATFIWMTAGMIIYLYTKSM